jgi:hypothetical protein
MVKGMETTRVSMAVMRVGDGGTWRSPGVFGFGRVVAGY